MTVDLADPALYARGDPHAVWRALRRADPVHWQPGTGGPGFWSVVRYEDVQRVLSDHTRFTSERGTLLNLLGRGDPAGGRQLAVTDPPRHDRMRAPLHRALKPRSVQAHTGVIRDGIRALLPGRDRPEFDLAAVCGLLPLTVLGPLLSLPEADRPHLVRLALMSAAEEDPAVQLPQGPAATLHRAHRELFAYFADLVRERRRRPRGDLVDVLLAMEVDGVRLTPGEVLSNCYSLLLGAGVTLAHVPTAAVAELSRDGGYEAWAADPGLLAGGVEEALRWASPAGHFMRHARHDTVLAGVPVAAGDAVVAWLGAANRDPAVFAGPDVFDPARSGNRHLAFGAGPHYCVGAGIARVTLRLFFAELFARYASLRLAGEPVRARSTFLSGYLQMPVRAGFRGRGKEQR
ncbi:cytochrome P450 [Streptomyces fumanus]|uniref:Cytochrome P450 n=1 Tax=Streptomyces fumanus TaxID=67302 RepID=A0A919E0J4_9ACTN|nr:cytochrome P450 [Streptomyces fumanus]GHE97485.1 cytochrome P450 [Streptomyces fumanus]